MRALTVESGALALSCAMLARPGATRLLAALPNYVDATSGALRLRHWRWSACSLAEVGSGAFPAWSAFSSTASRSRGDCPSGEGADAEAQRAALHWILAPPARDQSAAFAVHARAQLLLHALDDAGSAGSVAGVPSATPPPRADPGESASGELILFTVTF